MPGEASNRQDNGRWKQRLWNHCDFWLMVAGSVIIIPFVFSRGTADPFLTPRFLVKAVLCSGLHVIHLMRTTGASRHRMHYHDAVLLWLTIYLLISLSSLSMALNLGEGLTQWLKAFLLYAFIYGAVLTLRYDSGRLHQLVRAILLASIAFVGIGGIQSVVPETIAIPGYAGLSGTMGNKNLFASAMFLMLPFSLFAIFHYRGVWLRVGWASGCLLSVGIWVARARSVWVAVLVSGAAVLLTTPACRQTLKRIRSQGVWRSSRGGRQRLKPAQTKRPYRIAATGVAGGLAVAVCLALVFHRPATDTQWLSTASMQDRLLLWQKTIRMVISHPIRGVGVGQWKLNLPRYGPIERGFAVDGVRYEVVFQRPHNDFLWVLAESGIPGLICLIAFFATLVLRCYRILNHDRSDSVQCLLPCMLFGVIGYMVIGFFSFPGERIFHNTFLGLVIAIILSVDHPSRQHPCWQISSSPGASRWGHGLILAGCIFSTVAGSSRYVSDRHACDALTAIARGNDASAIVALDRAETWLYTMDPTSTPLAFYRAMAHYRMGHLAQAGSEFVMACEAHPFHYHSLVNAAACLKAGGHRTAAERYRQRAGQLAIIGRMPYTGRPDER